MIRIAAPLRFLILAIGSWIGIRLAMIVPSLIGGVADGAADGTAIAADMPAARPLAAAAVARDGQPPSPSPSSPPPSARAETPRPVAPLPAWQLASRAPPPAPPPAAPRQDMAPAVPSWPSPAAPPARSGWSGSAWLFARPDEGRAGLAAGGQIGGSQAGARIAYRVAEGDMGAVATAARISTPLAHGKGAEAAIGIDWLAPSALPLRLSIERRIAIGREGRDAWSGYAAGGFYRRVRGLELDGYAQAGVVGAKARDLFADGAVRIARPVPLGSAQRLLIGGGAWGATQPGATRLDIGPRAAIRMPIAGTTMTGAIEGRIRIAGNARPGSGAAFTLATDF